MCSPTFTVWNWMQWENGRPVNVTLKHSVEQTVHAELKAVVNYLLYCLLETFAWPRWAKYTDIVKLKTCQVFCWHSRNCSIQIYLPHFFLSMGTPLFCPSVCWILQVQCIMQSRYAYEIYMLYLYYVYINNYSNAYCSEWIGNITNLNKIA